MADFGGTGAAGASPVTIFDNTSGSVNGGLGVTATTWLASKFCLGSQPYGLESVSLLLNNQDSSGGAGPPCTVQLHIYSNNPANGKPAADTGLIMNLSGLTNPITLLNGQQLVKWTPATPFSLLADTCYWAVLSAEDGKRMGQISSFTPPTGAAADLRANAFQRRWGDVASAFHGRQLQNADPRHDRAGCSGSCGLRDPPFRK